MRKILSIAWNDCRIEFSERSTLIFFLVLPIIFTAVVGVGLKSSYQPSDPNADRRFVVLVADQDGSSLSDKLVEVMAASAVIRPEPQPLGEAERLLGANSLPGLLIIPAGFQEAVLAGQGATVTLREPANDDRTLTVGPAVDLAVNRVAMAATIAGASVDEASRIRPFADAASQEAYFAQGLDLALEQLENSAASVQVTSAPEATLDLGTSFDQSSAGQLVTWVLITLLGAAEVFVSERLGGTLRRLVTMPVTKATILVGKITGRLGMGLVQMVLLVGVGAWLFGANWGHSPLALAIMLLAFGLAAVAMGVFLGTVAKSRGQVSGMVTMVAMVSAALGGCWWPLEITPATYQTAVKVLPSTWAMIGFKDVMIRGAGVVDILPIAGILLGFAALFFALGIWRFRFE